jgi:pilus assembly protein CpaF
MRRPRSGRVAATLSAWRAVGEGLATVFSFVVLLGATQLFVLAPDLVGRLSLAASEAVGAVEAELESSGERLDEVSRELLVSNAVDEELARVNTDRLRSGGAVVDDEDRRLAQTLVWAELYGSRGRIGALLQDLSWDELNINSAAVAWLSYGDGRKVLLDPPLFADDDELLAWLKTTARRGSDIGEFEFSAASPRLSMQLTDGSRLHALYGGRGSGGLGPHPIACIRRHRVLEKMLDQLALGSPKVVACMRAIVRAKRTVLVTGDTGSGKTTTARALAHELPYHVRIATLESTRELFLEEFPELHGDVVVLEARSANVEGEGAHTQADLVEDTLRIHPSRIWMGEILGPAESTSLLNALSGGHRGSCATLHATSAAGELFRLQTLCEQPPHNLTPAATNSLIASSIDFVIHLGVDEIEEDRGRVVRFVRYVSEIIAITGYDGEQVTHDVVFEPGPDGRAVPARAMNTETHQALKAHGYDHRAVIG